MGLVGGEPDGDCWLVGDLDGSGEYHPGESSWHPLGLPMFHPVPAPQLSWRLVTLPPRIHPLPLPTLTATAEVREEVRLVTIRILDAELVGRRAQALAPELMFGPRSVLVEPRQATTGMEAHRAAREVQDRGQVSQSLSSPSSWSFIPPSPLLLSIAFAIFIVCFIYFDETSGTWAVFLCPHRIPLQLSVCLLGFVFII